MISIGYRTLLKAVKDGKRPGDTVLGVSTREDADLVSSQSAWEAGVHYPLLDIDLPAQLVPSSTEGHFHLYLEKPMQWGDYVFLLKALEHVGVLQKGFVRCAIERGRTQCRLPEKPKSTETPDSPLYHASSADEDNVTITEEDPF
jgi:hypothetical protein